MHIRYTDVWQRWASELGREPTAQEIVQFARQLEQQYYLENTLFYRQGQGLPGLVDWEAVQLLLEWSEYVDERKDQEVEAFRKSMLDAGTSESEAALGAQAVDLLLGPVEGTVRVLLMGGASVEAWGKGVGKSIGMGLPYGFYYCIPLM